MIDGDSIKIKTDINNDFQRNQLKNLECPDTRSSTKNKLLAKKFNISEKEVMQRGKDTKKFVVEFLKQHKSNITIEYDFLYTEDVWGRKYVRLYVEGQNLAQMLIDKEKCFFKENPKIFFVQNVGFSQRIIVLLQFALSLSPIVLLIFYIIKKTKLFHTHTEIIQFILKGLFLLLGVFVYTCVNLLCPISTFISTNWLFRILLVFFIYHSTYILIFYTKFLLNIDDNVAFALWWICIFLVYCACISNVKHCDDEQYARVHEYTYTCSFDYIF